MNGSARTDAAGALVHLQRRRILISFVIATVGMLAPRVRASAAAPGSVEPSAEKWQRVLQDMFPHEGIDASLYLVPAEALTSAAAKDPATRSLLLEGWSTLDRAAGDDWLHAPADARLRALSEITGTPLFVLLRQTTVFTFYGNPQVWQAFGYDGDAWSFGGYLSRGLVTVDWLPNPPAPPGGD